MSTLAVGPSVATAPFEKSPGRLRLEYLDGLRGTAALYVALHHSVLYSFWKMNAAQIPAIWRILTGWLAWGHYSVDVFIVLSGYCLMLPVARSSHGGLNGSVLAYLRRRARRILPPYYAALALTLILIVLIPAIRHASAHSGVHWNDWLPAFTPGVLLSHLLLIHNLNPAWIDKIDGPMWSVATEWQIYFAFPVLLVLWRRFGLSVAVLGALAVGLLLHFALRRLDPACPWFLGLFALGMAGAAIGFGRELRWQAMRNWPGWGLTAASLWAVVLVISVLRPRWPPHHLYLFDPLVGAATVALLVFCTAAITRESGKPWPLILRVFDSRPCVRLGAFSYSLYLVHGPILSTLQMLTRLWHLPPIAYVPVLTGLGVPLAVLAAYGFHLVFEKRFMSAPQKDHPDKVAVLV